MSSIVPAANYSFYVIPAFYVLNLVPQVYGATILKNANNGSSDHANPRTHATSLKKNTPKEIYGRYERAQAAHNNGFENLPLIAAAIICGNMARLDPSTLNTVAGFCRLSFRSKSGPIGRTSRVLRHVSTAFILETLYFQSVSTRRNADSDII